MSLDRVSGRSLFVGTQTRIGWQDKVPQHLSMPRVISSGEVQPADEDRRLGHAVPLDHSLGSGQDPADVPRQGWR
jgi:hypothetical protein